MEIQLLLQRQVIDDKKLHGKMSFALRYILKSGSCRFQKICLRKKTIDLGDNYWATYYFWISRNHAGYHRIWNEDMDYIPLFTSLIHALKPNYYAGSEDVLCIIDDLLESNNDGDINRWLKFQHPIYRVLLHNKANPINNIFKDFLNTLEEKRQELRIHLLTTMEVETIWQNTATSARCEGMWEDLSSLLSRTFD